MYINEGYWSVIFFSLCGFSIGGIMRSFLAAPRTGQTYPHFEGFLHWLSSLLKMLFLWIIYPLRQGHPNVTFPKETNFALSITV